MRIKINNYVPMFQEGGVMELDPAAQGMPEQAAPEAQAGPEQLLLEAAAYAVQNLDCNTGLQVCQMLLQLAQGGAPQEPAGEPVYRKGGILVRRIRR